jgi:HAD superfamily hydrolase (TIGR01509 family)
MITALIFDFDGLLVDTETPGLVSWQQIYATFGQTLSLDLWKGALGTNHGFNALEHLATLYGQPFDREEVLRRRQELKHRLSAEQPLLPGVQSILAQAHALGLPCAVASSSSRAWVEGWLNHHGIRHHFACVRTADDVQLTKPAPDLFLSAAACLGVPPSACLVFEDSPNGILAARAAAMRCVAVPGAITRQIALPPADLTLATLDEMPLTELLAHFNTTS